MGFNSGFKGLTMSAKFKSKSHEKRLTVSNFTWYAAHLHTIYHALLNTKYVRKRTRQTNVLDEQTVKTRIRLQETLMWKRHKTVGSIKSYGS